jgi:DNA-binding beta-propeller fold protein YncE
MRMMAHAVTAAVWGACLPAQSLPLVAVQTIDLGPVSGRIDHLGFEPSTKRLFVSALANNTVEVVDTITAAHVKSLMGFREPQGIAAVPEVGGVAVANGRGTGVDILSATDYGRIRSVRLGDDADNIRYDGETKRLFVGYGRGILAAVNPGDGAVVGRVQLPGHPESFQLERSGPRIFVNVPTANLIAVIDRRAMKTVATWAVTTAKAHYPMALDEDGHRLFIGARQPAMALVFDTDTGREIASFDITGDADDLFFDTVRKRLYVSGGEGFVDVLEQKDATHFGRVARIRTAPGARTSLFVPEQNRFYLAVPRRGGQAAEIRVFDVR